MITKQQFIEVINCVRESENFCTELSQYGVDVWSTPSVRFVYQLSDIIINTNFTEEGIDIINSWLYEADPDEPVVYIGDETQVIYTADELWETVKPYLL